MGKHGPRRRLIDITVDEALEARCVAQRAVDHWEAALSDGVITMEEALEGVRLGRLALAESQDVVRVAEQANQHQRIGIAYLTGTMTPQVLHDAAEVGITPDMPSAA